jgi:hypothetical protein
MNIIKKIRLSFLVVLFNVLAINSFADGGLIPFYKIGNVQGTVPETAKKIKDALTASSFEIIGEYNPAKRDNMLIIAFTRKDLTEITVQTKNRGAMASALKVGLLADSLGNIEVTVVNPIYVFYAYLRTDVEKNEESLNAISQDVLMALSKIGSNLTPFGGKSLNETELENFRFIPRMPGFDEPIILNIMPSYDEAVSLVRRNLMARKNGTFKVYELTWPDLGVAVFGVGLLDNRMGESRVLEVLNERHLAAFPYEIIISGNQVSMLNGRFRFPLFWSDLSMNEFRKINKTTRDIQDMLESLTKTAGQ